jgi:hypothetical protein
MPVLSRWRVKEDEPGFERADDEPEEWELAPTPYLVGSLHEKFFFRVIRDGEKHFYDTPSDFERHCNLDAAYPDKEERACMMDARARWWSNVQWCNEKLQGLNDEQQDGESQTTCDDIAF